MNNRTILATAIAFAAYFCVVPGFQAQRDDSPSAFDKCRIVTTEDLVDRGAPAFAAYRVASPETVENSNLDPKSNPTPRMYRTVLRREIALGPNFAVDTTELPSGAAVLPVL